jgi:hypothetical protein
MKPAEAKAIIEDCRKRGYIEHDGVFYPPAQAARRQLSQAALKPARKPKAKRTGWIDDELNIRNKEKYQDMFMRLVKIELGLSVWPEFYFTLEKQYRFDYAIPTGCNNTMLKIAIEVEGGIWAKGNSGHSSGTGIARDMKKSTLANVNGWTLIRCTPTDIKNQPGKVIDLIKKSIENKK